MIKHWSTRLIAAFLFAVVLVNIPIERARAPFPLHTTAPYYFFGDLMTVPEHAQYESRHGINTAMLELRWDAYEPHDGQFDSNYAASVKSQLDILLEAGMRVTLGLGLHYTPSWVFAYPNSRFVNQDGAMAEQGCSSTNEVNMVFNQVLRQKAEAYFDQIDRDLGLRNVWAIRLTSGGDCEMLFPDVSVYGGSYWAFDANAQNGPDMPPSMERNPFPGWKPGQRIYHGHPFTTFQVGQWADWYIKALDNVAGWQMNAFNRLGFHGYYQPVTPGAGVRPSTYAGDINNYLPNSIMGFGAIWDTFYAFLSSRQHVMAYVSSVADNSGNNDSCQPSDDNVALTDPTTNQWSATRWISRIADQYHLPKAGENPGYGMPSSLNSSYLDQSSGGMMASTMRQMQSCHFQGVYWAHDYRLWDGTLPFGFYASYIAQIDGPN